MKARSIGVTPRNTPKGRPPKATARDLKALALDLAVAGFARHGYRGMSLRMISDELRVSVSSVAYHFKSKANLYSLVLSRIARDLDGLADRIAQGPADAGSIIDAIQQWTRNHASYTQIVMRDMLENADRAQYVQHWYLKDSVDRLVALLAASDPDRDDPAIRLATLLGAITYTEIAMPTIVAQIDGIGAAEARRRIGQVLERL